MIETGFATRVNWLCTIVKSPWSNLRRAYKSVLRRVQRVSSKGKDHSGPASQGYMHRTDKPKSLVLEEFQRNGLKVRAERRILVGLNPRKVSVYRIFWLERS